METHEDATPINTMDEMLQGSIYLWTTTNFQGGCNFIKLRLGRRITRNKFNPLPIPQYIIKQVKDMAIKEYCYEYLIFTDRNGSTI